MIKQSRISMCLADLNLCNSSLQDLTLLSYKPILTLFIFPTLNLSKFNLINSKASIIITSSSIIINLIKVIFQTLLLKSLQRIKALSNLVPITKLRKIAIASMETSMDTIDHLLEPEELRITRRL